MIQLRLSPSFLGDSENKNKGVKKEMKELMD
jgi:hypothetical protein